MVKKRTIETGNRLEARVQRLFMCQGAFAERALLLRPTKDAANLVTDVDVVAHDYNLNFHHSRIYAECKGGSGVKTLDRIVWVRGMMHVLGAERGYLVVDHCSPESVTFAIPHGVEVLQQSGLDALENALGINANFWPGRSNLTVYDPLYRLALKEADSGATGLQHWLRAASDIWRDASALSLSYGRLNNLIAQLERFGGLVKIEAIPESDQIYHYAVAALLVRLSQYVLFLASETLGLTKSEREQYIGERLMAGSLGIEQTRLVVRSALKLAKTKLEELNVVPPPNWDSQHLLSPPPYTRALSEVVDRVVADGTRARVLPLAMEIRLFGFEGNEKGSAGLVRRVDYSMPLTGLIRGFAVQSLGVPEFLTQGLVARPPAALPIPSPDISQTALPGDDPLNLPGIKT